MARVAGSCVVGVGMGVGVGETSSGIWPRLRHRSTLPRMTIDLGEAFRAARDRISQLAAGESVDLRLPVPATPDWSGHCVISHLSGIAADASTGNMEGAPGEAWTAEQVATVGLSPVEVTASDFECFRARLGRATSPLGEISLGMRE